MMKYTFFPATIGGHDCLVSGWYSTTGVVPFIPIKSECLYTGADMSRVLFFPEDPESVGGMLLYLTRRAEETASEVIHVTDQASDFQAGRDCSPG